MLRDITKENVKDIKGKDFKKYAKMYIDIYDRYIQGVESLGIDFEKHKESKKDELLEKIREKGGNVLNDGASVNINAKSSACSACKIGKGSLTSYISLMCHRNCYYCFNPNQENYSCHLHAKKDWLGELEGVKKAGVNLTHVALTGGEPLLHKEETIKFFNYVKENFNGAHKRLYTSGDLLDEEVLRSLKEAGLDEIRFSLKLEDTEEEMEKVFSNMALSKKYIKDVMVEMPVIPGTLEKMKEILLRLEEIGIYSVNLLEFCLPFVNIDEFKKRGHKVKFPPHKTLYNFWYAGGLPVDGSEELCLSLIYFAIEKGLKLGVHYCSLENKHFGQIYAQNTTNFKYDNTYIFSKDDFYLKTAKVFGSKIDEVLDILHEKNIEDYTINEEYNFIQFNPKHIEDIKALDTEIGISYNIVENREGELLIRELKICHTTKEDFKINEL